MVASKPGIAVDFDDVHSTEDHELAKRRKKRGTPPSENGPVGLALSGGGIRSAATCLGAIQALAVSRRFREIDYLSTVSGGGYIGSCLSAAMSAQGGGEFPFGTTFRDSEVVGHIRNYSNYLLPRSRSALRNWSEAAAILLRGLVANAVCVFAFLLPAAAITVTAYSFDEAEARFNLLPNLADRIAGWAGWQMELDPGFHFFVPAALAAVLSVLLIGWAVLRSHPIFDREINDTSTVVLVWARMLLALALVTAVLDLQLVILDWLVRTDLGKEVPQRLKGLGGALATFGGVVTLFSSTLGKFLETSKRSSKWTTALLRWAIHAALFLAALILPLFLWIGYLAAAEWAVGSWPPDPAAVAARLSWMWIVSAGCWIVMLGLRANGYSLHRLYRDRLSKAFLVSTREPASDEAGKTRLARTASDRGDLPPLDSLKLSDLQDSHGPYPLINAALNVQGSLEANRRGREADFFEFTPHFVGSKLTGYAPIGDMQKQDSRLDLASAVAISGAAASANMGGKTIRLMSPTLSLLNIRLGYYLFNPRHVGERPRGLMDRVRMKLHDWADRPYLLIEMFNGLTEMRRHVYLTDGGHIENLGIYALLRRKCRTIVAIDAEADPELGCESLLQLQRFARIDLGIRIVLPWEEIRRQTRMVSDRIPTHDAPCDHGPHAAIGRILYPDGTTGLLVYVKSSLSGDEKDYILDYAERNPAFPHETTGDQFFSEEQFEMYRALGFHMIDGMFDRDRIAFANDGEGAFESERAARAALDAALPAGPVDSDPPPA